MSQAVEVVRDPDALARLVDRFRREPVIGVDTEAASFHRYHDRVYLLQLSSRDHTAVVDPLAMGGLPGLAELLTDENVELVFHDADYDLRLLRHEYGIRARRLFDTRVAAQLVNEPGIGLASLLLRRFGIEVNKRFQRADWSLRPLSAEMIAYAATDTRHLLALHASLRDDLGRMGRLAWLEEECAILTEVEWGPPEPAETAFLRLKGARALDRRGLAVLREVFVWRDQLAARLDRALFRVLANEALLALAASRPRTLANLAAVRGIGRDLLTRHGKDILEAIERGLAIPEAALPRMPRGQGRRPDPDFETRLDRLRSARAELAARFDLPPGVLCPSGSLEAIARATPTSLEELRRVEGIRRWQVDAFGAELIAAIAEA
jgi:ribonuclease D